MNFRVSDPVFRAVALVLATIATLAFAYNQVAQARAVRYRPLSEGARLAVDTWGDRLCLFTGECYPIVRATPASAAQRRSAPPALDTGFNVDTTP